MKHSGASLPSLAGVVSFLFGRTFGAEGQSGKTSAAFGKKHCTFFQKVLHQFPKRTASFLWRLMHFVRRTERLPTDGAAFYAE